MWQVTILFVGIQLRMGFWLMDRKVCTGISGHKKGGPREVTWVLSSW